jgi:uncharacterized membrane protein YidH (DUF202 family)
VGTQEARVVLLGVIIAVAGFAAIAIAYYNRDELNGPMTPRVRLGYIAAFVLVIAIAAAAAAVLDQPTEGPAPHAVM